MLEGAPNEDPAAPPKGLATVGDAASAAPKGTGEAAAAPKSFDEAADAAGVPKRPPLGALRKRLDAVAATGAAGAGAVGPPRSSAQTLSKRGFSSSAALSMRRVA
jgi:hypothetical protein